MRSRASSKARGIMTRQCRIPRLLCASGRAKLSKIELNLINERGLPRRPWYKHEIYAPGFYTGYGAKTLPGIREAIEQHKWDEAAEQIGIAATAIDRSAAQIDRATAI